MDWAEMLERMYLRWSQAQGYSTRILDRNTGVYTAFVKMIN